MSLKDAKRNTKNTTRHDKCRHASMATTSSISTTFGVPK
jgi:hypothetical protein